MTHSSNSESSCSKNPHKQLLNQRSAGQPQFVNSTTTKRNHYTALGITFDVVVNYRNKTPRTGIIDTAIWHHKLGIWHYRLVDDAGHSISKRYEAPDLIASSQTSGNNAVNGSADDACFEIKVFWRRPVTANVLTKALYRVVTCRPFIYYSERKRSVDNDFYVLLFYGTTSLIGFKTGLLVYGLVLGIFLGGWYGYLRATKTIGLGPVWLLFVMATGALLAPAIDGDGLKLQSCSVSSTVG